MSRRCFIHVGLPKTGTSFLQSVLLGSQDALSAQGLALLPQPASLRSSTQLMRAVRGRLVEGVDHSTAEETLSAFRGQARDAAGSDILVSQEQLASATRRQARRLFSLVPEHEVHVIVTARTIARQIPSGWQERVKIRSTHEYDRFVEAVIRRDRLARDFWRHQDLLDVVRRWGAHLPPDRLHIVTVPPPGSPPRLLVDRYCEVLGVDAQSLQAGSSRSNASLGQVQAELLRRVNVELGDRLRPNIAGGYTGMAKWFLADRILRGQGGEPPRLPSTAEQWCRETTEEWVRALEASGHHVVGDLGDLAPLASQFSDGLQQVKDEDVAASAVAALASILDLRHRERMEHGRLRARLAEQEEELAGLRAELAARRRPRDVASRLTARLGAVLRALRAPTPRNGDGR